MSTAVQTLFRIATSPKGLGWSAEQFWKSTYPEFEMAVEGASGRYRSGPLVSREDMAFLAKVHGKKKSIRKQPS